MIDDGEAKEIKRDYLETLELLLQNIKRKANEREIKTDDSVSIYVGRKQAYKGIIGQPSDKNLLTDKQVKNINNALTEPSKSQGFISIKIGKTEVFRVQNGKVTNDQLGLVPSQANQTERIYSVDNLQKQVDVLQTKLEIQQELINNIKNTDPTPDTLKQLAEKVQEMSKSLVKQQQLIEKTQNVMNLSFSQTKNTKLQDWVGGVEKNVKQVAQNVFGRLKARLEPQIERVRHDVDKKIDGLRSEVDSKINSVKTAVNDLKSQAIEKSVKALIKHLGKKNADGSISFESKTLDFTQRDNQISVRAKDGTPVMDSGRLLPAISIEHLEALDKVQPIVERFDRFQEKQTVPQANRSARQ